MTRLHHISSSHVGRKLTIAFISTLLLLLAGLNHTSASPDIVTFEYEFDRSKLPNLNSTELTVLISVGDATGIQIRDERRAPVSYTHLRRSQKIMVTSEAQTLIVELAGVTDFNQLGDISKANLKDNKLWAWSHSFDDNHFLEEAIDIMQKHDLPATMYVVGDWIDSGYPWEGDLTALELHQLMDAGWSIGNHTLDHDNNCGVRPSLAERRQSILHTEITLKEVIQTSNRPNYKVISFAVPCGGADRFNDYHQIVKKLRDEGKTDLLFSEGGHEAPLHIDASPHFDFDLQIKRDLAIDGEEDNTAEIKAIFDSASLNARTKSAGVFWYNSFSHGTRTFGNNAYKLNAVAEYFVATYGKNGSDEAWMAPADEIYSYLLVRDLTTITTAVTSPPIEPTPAETPQPSSTPTATPNSSLPTVEPTATLDFMVTSTPIPPAGGDTVSKLYLPYLVKQVSRSSD